MYWEMGLCHHMEVRNITEDSGLLVLMLRIRVTDVWKDCMVFIFRD
jgi:hypothetical protein